MSKHWKPKKQTVALEDAPRVSRIRRDPVRVPTPAELKMAEIRKQQREIWGGATGVIVLAVALFVVIIGVSAATLVHEDREAARRALMYSQCYESTGPNCVVDGNTIYVAGEKVRIAGIVAPRIRDSACPDERSKGIDTALRLADILNSGKVTLGAASKDSSGREARDVEVNGLDLRQRMIAQDLARPDDGASVNYCGSQS